MKSTAFYSYKGGSGRSTACVNFLYFFARRVEATPEHPIILIDCDIDSAGLTYLLQRNCKNVDRFRSTDMYRIFSLQSILFGDDGNTTGDVRGTNSFPAAVPLANNPFFTSLIPVGDFFGLDEKCVLFLPCDLSRRTDNYNMSDERRRSFRAITRIATRYNCSGVVFDCPAGTQELAMWSLNEVNNIVCCLRPTFQFRRGTTDSLVTYCQENSPLTEKQIILCPNAVSMKEMTFYGHQYPSTVRNVLRTEVFDEINRVCGQDSGYRLLANMLINTPEEYRTSRKAALKDVDLIGIPEVERFKWFEECLGSINLENDDEMLAQERYEYLASLIM